MKTKKLLITLLMPTLFVNPVKASGVPVVDIANLAQMVVDYTVQSDQLLQAIETLTQLKDQYEALTEQFNNFDPVETLEDSAQQSFNMILNGDSSEINGASSLRNQLEYRDLCADMNDVDEECAKRKGRMYGNLAMIKNISDNIQTHTTNIDKLMNKVNSSASIKDIAEINSAINIEKAAMASLQTRARLLASQSEMQEQIDAQIVREKFAEKTEEHHQKYDDMLQEWQRRYTGSNAAAENLSNADLDRILEQ